jgi:hypothetical protein
MRGVFNTFYPTLGRGKAWQISLINCTVCNWVGRRFPLEITLGNVSEAVRALRWITSSKISRLLNWVWSLYFLRSKWLQKYSLEIHYWKGTETFYPTLGRGKVWQCLLKRSHHKIYKIIFTIFGNYIFIFSLKGSIPNKSHKNVCCLYRTISRPKDWNILFAHMITNYPTSDREFTAYRRNYILRNSKLEIGIKT